MKHWGGHFNRDALWAELRDRPGATAAELGTILGRKTTRVRVALYILRDAGSAKRVIVRGKARWEAIGKPPTDPRGKSPGAAYGRSFGGKLEHVMIAVAARLEKQAAGTLQVRRDRNGRFRKSSKTLLEMCWPTPVTTSKTLALVNGHNAIQGPKRPIGVGIAESEEAA